MQPFTNVKKGPYVTFDDLWGHTSFLKTCTRKNLDKIQGPDLYEFLEEFLTENYLIRIFFWNFFLSFFSNLVLK